MITEEEQDSAKSSEPAATSTQPKTPSAFQSDEAAHSDRRTPDGAADGRQEHLERIERLLDEMRGLLDTLVRTRRHREFSALRLIGSAIQALVIALLAWALSDWVFQALAGTVLVKLGFAAVLQLIALTAFLLSRTDAS